MKAIKIKCDTDGERIRLPKTIEIPNAVVAQDAEETPDDHEVISDYITDQTGFCHFGFELAE